jgi:hypothetical protein
MRLAALVATVLPVAIRYSRMTNQLGTLVAAVGRLGGRAGIDEGGFDLMRGRMDVWIDLRGAGINDAALAGIAAMPVFRDVGRLSLAGTRITDEGVKLLMGHPSLVALDLSKTAVGDKSFESLAAVRGLNGLKLSGTSVSDVGLVTLARARGPSPQMLLDVTDTAVSEQGARKLSAAFSQWNIIYGSSKDPKKIR